MEPQLVKDIQQCCTSLLPSWASLSQDDIAVEPLTGGLTNDLFIASTSAAEAPKKVVVRCLCDGMEDALNRVREDLVVQAVSEAGVGPRIYGTKGSMRLEEFLEGRTLHAKELMAPAISCHIAQRLAQLHRLSLSFDRSEAGSQCDWPLFPSSVKDMRRHAVDTLTALQEQRSSGNSKEGKEEERETEEGSSGDIAVANSPEGIAMIQEILSIITSEALEEYCDVLKNVTSPVVFCHNDLNEGNVVLGKGADGKEKATLIDFEYGAYNRRGCDFANYFNECSLDNQHEPPPYVALHEDWYPSEAAQRAFFKEYLSAAGSSSDTVESLMQEARFYVPASHAFWAVWCVPMSVTSKASMWGYLEYGIIRAKAFRAAVQALKKQHLWQQEAA